MKQGSGWGRRALILGLAALAHLLVFAAFGWHIPGLREPPVRDEESSPIDVLLYRLHPQAQPPRATTPVTAKPLEAYRPRPPAAVPEEQAQAPIPLPPPSPPPVPETHAAVDADRLRSALRGLTGCNGPSVNHLTHEEKLACDQRLAKASPAPVQQPFSARELADFNGDKAREQQGSILSRALHNNCLPRLGNRPSPTGTASRGASAAAQTAAGVGCSMSF